jgi:hypothetical protein
VQLGGLIAYKSLVWGAGQAQVGGVSLKVYTPGVDGKENGMDMAAGCALTLVDKAYTPYAAIYMPWSELRAHTFLEIHLRLQAFPTQSIPHGIANPSATPYVAHHPHSHRPRLCVTARAGTAVSHLTHAASRARLHPDRDLPHSF